MAIQTFRPTSAGVRTKVAIKIDSLHKGRPEKGLVESRAKGSGRNNTGRITVRHRGGGHKRLIRLVDFRRNKDGVAAKVVRIERDPNRSALIALLSYVDGEKRYIIAPKGLEVGAELLSGADAPIRVGNCLPLRAIPVGTVVHGLEYYPGSGAKVARTAGASVQLMGKEGEYATLRLRSGEMRRFSLDCRATIGEVGNSEHALKVLGKAGAKRWLGIRPTVRGVAMNPVDHPHGGGEGRTSGGRHPVTPWGQPTKGAKTRTSTRNRHLIIGRKR